MNTKRYLHIILIFLVCMISISAVSAADDSLNDINDANADQEFILEDNINDDVLTNDENDELNLKENNVEDKAKLGEGTSTGTFTDLNDAINGNSDNTVTLRRNYTYDGVDDHDTAFKKGIVINRPVTIDGQGCTLNGNNLSRIFYIRDTNGVTIKNINFINGNAGDDLQGGAVYLGDAYRDYTVMNCTFINNTAIYAGAMCLGTAIDCTFIGNQASGDPASCGGAMTYGTAINCTFIKNCAKGAIAMGGATYSTDAYNCSFVQNSIEAGEYASWDDVSNPIGHAGVGGAMIYGIANNCVFINNPAQFNEDNENTFRTECTNCKFYKNVIINASNFKTKVNSGDILPFQVGIFEYGSNAYEYFDGINVTITLWKGGKFFDKNYALTGEGWPVNLPKGIYNATLSVWGIEKNISILVETATKLTATKVTATYNVNKNLIITLKDIAGNPISGVKVTVDLNGAKKYTTDKNGQVKVAVGKLVPKTYTAKISFAGNAIHKASSTTAKVTVKKATPKLTASAKSFKFEDKTKKYTVTLKDNKGKVLKNKKVTLKVNGKTYTATTNSKGVATFKLSKLTKKGTFTAVVNYAGDKYYNKISKKAKVTIKAPAWNTVSKGSKDKATVKKIQQALKDNGYYLTYKGHYLKIDGIYHDCTERSVKEFQKDKKLKVTGKVDYATAKKLKIVN